MLLSFLSQQSGLVFLLPLLFVLLQLLLLLIFPDMPCIKRFTETKRRRSTLQQPRTKSASLPADNPRINRSSTARCVPPSVDISFRLFVLLERIVLSASSPARLRLAAPPCASTRRARGMCGFWIRQVLLHSRTCLATKTDKRRYTHQHPKKKRFSSR